MNFSDISAFIAFLGSSVAFLELYNAHVRGRDLHFVMYRYFKKENDCGMISILCLWAIVLWFIVEVLFLALCGSLSWEIVHDYHEMLRFIGISASRLCLLLVGCLCHLKI